MIETFGNTELSPYALLPASVFASILIAAMVRRVRKRRALRDLQRQRHASKFWGHLTHDIARRLDAVEADEYMRFMATYSRHWRFFVRLQFSQRKNRSDLGLYVFRRVPSQSLERDRPRPQTVQGSLFYLVMFFIPREIRSPWFDHLLEDRQRAAAEGRGRLFIASFTIFQCVALVARCCWNFAWDILNPFKGRRA